MATQTITVSNNISNEIEATGQQLVFNVEFNKPGNITLQRRIGTGSWYDEMLISTVLFGNRKVFEETISGLVPGQKLRFVFSKNAEVTTLTVLQS